LAYASIQDVELAAGGEDRLTALSDWAREGEVEEVAEAAIESAISEADAWIDSFISKRYNVPLEEGSIPNLIKHMSASEAVFILRARRSMTTEADMALHMERETALKGISTGQITLGLMPQPEKSPLVIDRQTARPNTKQVSRDALKGFH
jgi:phage gp36-like protein